MIATALILAAVLIAAVAAFVLMRANDRKSATAYDRRTGRRMIEQVVHLLGEDHGYDAPIAGQVLDEAWAAGNDAPAVFGLAPPAVQEGAEMALAVYERTIAAADAARQRNETVPTLDGLLDAVRLTDLDPRQPSSQASTAGAAR